MAEPDVIYHIVYRTGAQTSLLGTLGSAVSSHWTLEPFIGQLLATGVTSGEVVLVEAATGTEVTRRRVQPVKLCTPMRPSPRTTAGQARRVLRIPPVHVEHTLN